MKKLFLVLFWVLLGLSFLFGAWYVLHGDIQYTSDVARDFLLLEEIHTKGIVLIGPSSTTKLYHGVLWMYLNYPVYALSKGNPVASGWFWVFLSCLSCAAGFYFAKKLFTEATAYVYTLLLALFYAFHLRYFYNPDGAMLVLPAVFFFFIRYIQTKRVRFLLIHVLLLGAVIQFQMAIGIPFALLSFGYVLVQSIVWKKYAHMLSFLLVPLTLLNFIIFDLRHQFLQTHLLLNFLTSAGRDNGNLLSMLWQRLLYLSSTIEFFRVDVWQRNLITAVFFFLLLFVQIKDKKYAQLYKVFLYFYLGFFILSLGNAGGLLYFYVYPLFPLVFLLFASLMTSRYKILFIFVFLYMYTVNMAAAVGEAKAEAGLYAGKTADSWAFYHNMSQRVFAGKENSFGYFVFDPDIVAYQAKYALLYESRLSKKSAYYFEKKPITYLIIAHNSYHQDIWWTKNLLHITGQPDNTIQFDNGYRIEAYRLAGDDLTTSVEPNIDPGLMFR